MLSEIRLTDRGSGKKWELLRSCRSSQAILVITPRSSRPRPGGDRAEDHGHPPPTVRASPAPPLDFLRIPTILLYMDRIIERIYHGKIDY